MKFIIIGLGNLGYTMAKLLTEQGDEVIGVDSNLSRVEEYKNDMSSTICMDVSEFHALSSLPIKEVDVVIVAIGDVLSTSIEAVAYVKQLGAKRIFARTNSRVETAILEAIGIDCIMKPSEFAAEMYSFDVSSSKIEALFPVDDSYRIYEFKAPKVFLGNNIESLKLEDNFKMKLVSVLRPTFQLNMFGNKNNVLKVISDISPQTIINEGDVLVVFGRKEDFAKMKKLIS
ncbi:MAG: TrkA family potassium uptake protein [Bacteroidales bacterium]|nr:TrkA family potassium uptake protein [Bacteroidales bacterium]